MRRYRRRIGETPASPGQHDAALSRYARRPMDGTRRRRKSAASFCRTPVPNSLPNLGILEVFRGSRSNHNSVTYEFSESGSSFRAPPFHHTFPTRSASYATRDQLVLLAKRFAPERRVLPGRVRLATAMVEAALTRKASIESHYGWLEARTRHSGFVSVLVELENGRYRGIFWQIEFSENLGGMLVSLRDDTTAGQEVPLDSMSEFTVELPGAAPSAPG